MPGRESRAKAFFFQGPNAERLGFAHVLIEVAAISPVAFGEAEWQPVGGFVEGAGVLFRIVKTFRQQRREAVPGFKLAAEGAQRECQALVGEVGLAGAVDDTEAPQPNDQFEAVGAGHGVPPDVPVAFLEALGGSAPAKDGDEFGTVGRGVGAVDSLPEDVSGGASGLEVVFLVEGLAELVELGFFRGGAQDEVVADERGLGR